MIYSSVNLVPFIVRPKVGPDSKQQRRRNPVAGTRPIQSVARGPLATPNKVGFGGLEKCFNRRVIEAVALAAHRNRKLMPTQDFLIVVRAILRAPVRVMNASRRRLAQVDRHFKRPDARGPLHTIADRPTDDATRVEIQYHREVKPSFVGPGEPLSAIGSLHFVLGASAVKSFGHCPRTNGGQGLIPEGSAQY